MDLRHVYWILTLGRPKHRATIYELRSDPSSYIKDPVFFLSTGRCGTKWFSDLLKNKKDLAVFHDPIPSLASQGKTLYELMSKSVKSDELILKMSEELFWAAREDHMRYTFKTGKRYIETNNYITFFAPALEKIFPSAKFVHLVRHPGDFIRSGISRKYYVGGTRDLMRPVPQEGEALERWNEYTGLQKTAWLWKETNQFIEEFKSKLDPVKHITININKLELSSIQDFSSFLGIEINESRVKRLLPQKKNKQSTHTIGSYSEWSVKDIEQVVEITSELSSIYGYTFN